MQETPRVVLNTNLFVSGVISPVGTLKQLLQRWERGQIILLTSAELLAEVETVLRRDSSEKRGRRAHPAGGGVNQEVAPLRQEKEEENEGGEQGFDDSPGRLSEPTLISEITRNKSRSEQTKRPNSFEVNRILNMLIDERYPTCGVYRRFEEGRLSDEQLLEAISHESTGSFIEGERYKEAVEGCVRMLKEEEGIA
jgi:hypothetical protein